jgi:hypothetical protein
MAIILGKGSIEMGRPTKEETKSRLKMFISKEVEEKTDKAVVTGNEIVKSAGSVELTKAEKVEANKRYKDKLFEFKTREREHNRNELLLKYDIGEFVADVLESPKKYGTHAAEELSTDLNMHVDSVRLLHRYYLRYNRETVEKKLVPACMSWSAVQALISVADPKVRSAVETKAIKDGLSRDEIRDEVKKINSNDAKAKAAIGETKDKRGGLHDTSAFRNCQNAAIEMIPKLQQYADACDNMKTVTDPDHAQRLDAHRESAFKALEELSVALQQVLKR